MHSDPVADLLTRIRNGYRAHLQQVRIPHSRLKEHICEVLVREGYIQSFEVKRAEGKPQGEITVLLKYDSDRQPIPAGIKRFSTPGLRRYFGCDDIPKVRNGLGIVILTTPKGLMTDAEARRARVGGEALCTVW